MKNVVALFDRYEDASQAVTELTRNGFERDTLSLVANDASGKFGQQLGTTSGKEDNVADGAASGAGVGAVLGGIGGLLIGLGALAIPGIGPVLAAGPIMAALAGAGIGAAAGGLVGALADLGIPDEDADVYAESVRRGGTLLLAQVSDDRADRAAQILNQFNPIDIKERGAQYRASNWQGFNAQDKPYEGQQLNQSHASIGDKDRMGAHTYITDEGYLNKNVENEQRTVQGTERHSQVDVNKVDPKDMQRYEAVFRKHFDTTYSSSGRDFNQLRDAYFYGYQKGTDQRFSNHSWEQALPMIRQDWERESSQRRWEEYRDAVGEGYRRARTSA